MGYAEDTNAGHKQDLRESIAYWRKCSDTFQVALAQAEEDHVKALKAAQDEAASLKTSLAESEAKLAEMTRERDKWRTSADADHDQLVEIAEHLPIDYGDWDGPLAPLVGEIKAALAEAVALLGEIEGRSAMSGGRAGLTSDMCRRIDALLLTHSQPKETTGDRGDQLDTDGDSPRCRCGSIASVIEGTISTGQWRFACMDCDPGDFYYWVGRGRVYQWETLHRGDDTVEGWYRHLKEKTGGGGADLFLSMMKNQARSWWAKIPEPGTSSPSQTSDSEDPKTREVG